jgi:hypothetical protein
VAPHPQPQAPEPEVSLVSTSVHTEGQYEDSFKVETWQLVCELIESLEMCMWLIISNDILHDCSFPQNEEMNETTFLFTLTF